MVFYLCVENFMFSILRDLFVNMVIVDLIMNKL